MSDTTRSVAEQGLGLQAWLGRGEFDPAKVGRNPWPTEPRQKPDHGFFTSSWDGERPTSPWMEFWCTTPRAAKELDRQVWLLHPRADARLYVIDCAADYEDLVAEFTQRYQGHGVSPYVAPAPNWGGIVKTCGLTGPVITRQPDHRMDSRPAPPS